MSTQPQPLFDMSKAQPIFDMSKATSIGEAQPQSFSMWDKVKSYLSDAHAKAKEFDADAQKMSQKEFETKYGPINAESIGAPATAGLGPMAIGSGLEKFVQSKQEGETTGQAAKDALITGGSIYGGGKIIGKIAENLPGAKTEKAVAEFKDLQGALGEHTVSMTDDLKSALDELKEFTSVTGREPPSVVNKLVTRMADTDQPPLTYKEARMAYSDLSDLSASDKMQANAKMNRLLIPVKKALGDSISATADQAGRLEQYQGAMKGFAQAKGMEDKFDVAKKYLGRAIGTSALGAAGYAGYRTLKSVLGWGE